MEILEQWWLHVYHQQINTTKNQQILLNMHLELRTSRLKYDETSWMHHFKYQSIIRLSMTYDHKFFSWKMILQTRKSHLSKCSQVSCHSLLLSSTKWKKNSMIILHLRLKIENNILIWNKRSWIKDLTYWSWEQKWNFLSLKTKINRKK